MEDFSKYEQLFDSTIFMKECEKDDLNETKKADENKICEHKTTTTDKTGVICISCGKVIENLNWQNREWSTSIDIIKKPISEETDRNIFSDIKGFNLSERIESVANDIYKTVTKGRIFRGPNSRQGIIFACVYQAYFIEGNPQSYDDLINVFGITRKASLYGLKFVNMNYVHTIKQNNYENLITEILNKFDTPDSYKYDIIELYKNVKNKSSKLNRSRPQSICAGLVFYYIQKNSLNIGISEFSKHVKLSELTINKLVNEIKNCLN